MNHFDLPAKKEQIESLTNLTLDPNFWKDQKRSNKIIKDINNLKKIIESFDHIKNRADSLNDTINEFDGKDFDFLELISEEFEGFENEFKKFEIQTLLTGQYDNSNAIIEFHPGSGGTESQDWANMLFNMYCRYGEKHGFKVEVLDYQLADDAGIKSASIMISGENAFGYLKGESGVHRLVRISPFDAGARRHTSFASVEVTPEITDSLDVEIKDEDLKIDTYRSSGAGGQHINKTESAVRITHLPSGIVVACQNQRSQIQNKEKCLMMLTSKLAAIEYEKKQQELNSIKGDVKANEWGSQIRSYVLCPYTLVKDVRTGVEITNVDSVLNGEIDELLFGYLKSIVEGGYYDIKWKRSGRFL